MRLALLLNPSAGRGRARRMIDKATSHLRGRGVELDLYQSSNPDELIEIAERVTEMAYDRVVSCGGDGTLHLVVRKAKLRAATIGILPLGSGDDFARLLGIPRDVREACDVLLNGTVREVDVAKANGIRYLGVAGLGFDSEVARYANERVRFLRGSLIYLYAVFRVLGQFTPHAIRIIRDGEASDRQVMFMVVGNSTRYGGGIRIVPTAEIDDQILDLCIVSRCSKWELVKTLPLAYSGRHVTSPFVSLDRAARVTVECSEPLDVYADGEPITTTPVEFGLEDEKLRVVVPSGER